VAAGVLYPASGLLLSPINAAAAVGLSSMSVIGNAPSSSSGTNRGAHARRLESIRSTRNAKLGRKASPYAYRVLDIYLGLRKGTSGCIAPPRAPVRLSVFPSGKDGPLKPRRTVTP
jgi:hypothetical protein